eukprot:COSAG02_NODE_1570_length_11893_cov_2.376717_8_plen_62_part_00
MPEGWGRERNTHSWFVPAIARARVAVRWGPPAAGARDDVPAAACVRPCGVINQAPEHCLKG